VVLTVGAPTARSTVTPRSAGEISREHAHCFDILVRRLVFVRAADPQYRVRWLGIMAGETTKAAQATPPPVELIEMANGETATSGARWWVQAIQTLGVSTAAFFLLGFWANRTIEWEREKFLPALERSNSVTQTNNDVLKESTEVMRSVKAVIQAHETKGHNE
jgi:hypothetical protein